MRYLLRRRTTGEITVSWVPVLIIREVLDAVVHIASLFLRNQKRLMIAVALQHPFRRAARNDDAASEIRVEVILLPCRLAAL